MNDFIRQLIAASIRTLGLLFLFAHHVRLKTFAFNQRRLRNRYGVDSSTPIVKFGPEVEKSINREASRYRHRKFAETSGTSDRPKRILFTNGRLRSVKLAFIDMFARYCWQLRIMRTSLYVFSSFDQNRSLTSLLLDEAKPPSYLAMLQAPYRLQCHPAIKTLVAQYSTAAVRLWILTIANPGVLYSTNPSTLSTFLEELQNDWITCSKLIKDWITNPDSFDPEIKRIAKRLDSAGSGSRLRKIASSDVSLRFEDCVPGVGSYICWTGGYVQPFLDRVARYLPSDRYQLIPMYSMSTETIETVTHFQRNVVSHLPIASTVLYEFIELEDADDQINLLRPDELLPGKHYAMIVSDPYGLRRYQTEDVFRCNGKVNGLPDLSFVGRRSIEYSFTGEKLTLHQASKVIQQLRSEYDCLGRSFQTLVPSQLRELKPHYNLLLIRGGETLALPINDVGRRCDELLCETNCEYKSKRESGRLAAVQVVEVAMLDFLNRMVVGETWETQFKFLPFYRSDSVNS